MRFVFACLCFPITSLALSSRRGFGDARHMKNLTDLQKMVLEILHDHGHRRQGDLRHQLGCSRDELHAALTGLLQDGFIGKESYGRVTYFYLKARRAW